MTQSKQRWSQWQHEAQQDRHDYNTNSKGEKQGQEHKRDQNTKYNTTNKKENHMIKMKRMKMKIRSDKQLKKYWSQNELKW